MKLTLVVIGAFWFLYFTFRIFRNVPAYFDNFALGNSAWDMIWWWCEVLKIRMSGNISGWIFGKMTGYKGRRIKWK